MPQKKSIVELRAELAEIINKATYQGVRTIIARKDKHVAAIVSMADYERLEAMDRAAEAEAIERKGEEAGTR